MRSLKWGLWLACLVVAAQADEMQPGVVVVDGGLTGSHIRRGERLGPLGATGSVYLRQTLNNSLDFRANVAVYNQLQNGIDFGEALYDVGVVYHPSQLGPASLTLGWCYYDRNNNVSSPAFIGDDTQEAYFGVDFDLPLSPWCYVLYDFDRGEGRHHEEVGTYVNAGVTHQFAMSDAWTLDLSGRLGLDFGRGVDVFSDFLVRTDLKYRLDPHLTIGPCVDWWFPSHQVNPAAKGFRPILSFGVSYHTTY